MYEPPPRSTPPQQPSRNTRLTMLLLVVGVTAAAMLTVYLALPKPISPTSSFAVQPVNRDALQIVEGQLVYVPAYSEIFFGSSSATRQLTTTLAIHNTDLTHTIIVNSARYYDTNGQLVQEYIAEPLRIAPLATFGFVVDSADQRGGWGANFLVEWVAEEPVYEPIIEAVMISTQGVEGISFISPGRIISQTP
jgi:hypothetical protein